MWNISSVLPCDKLHFTVPGEELKVPLEPSSKNWKSDRHKNTKYTKSMSGSLKISKGGPWGPCNLHRRWILQLFASALQDTHHTCAQERTQPRSEWQEHQQPVIQTINRHKQHRDQSSGSPALAFCPGLYVWMLAWLTLVRRIGLENLPFEQAGSLKRWRDINSNQPLSKYARTRLPSKRAMTRHIWILCSFSAYSCTFYDIYCKYIMRRKWQKYAYTSSFGGGSSWKFQSWNTSSL